jgi:hypothetical protein
MTAARRRALLLLFVAALAAAALAFGSSRPKSPPPRPVAKRPRLLLLTSLPLMFREGFSLKGNGSEVLKRLQGRYRVEPVSVSSPTELGKARLLLMAQPLAQTAENLVALDEWVRNGGRVLLLADPLLEWPSERAPGDLLRPPPMFMDTGLLAHWGLRLDAPEQRGGVRRKLGGFDVIVVSPGELAGNCNVSRDRLVAHCRIGKGRATIVADADFLDVESLGDDAGHNIDGLLSELASLEHP